MSAAPVTAVGAGVEPELKPRLMILTPDFPPDHGGVQVLVDGLARSLTGFEVELVTLSHPRAADHDARLPFVTRRVKGPLPGRRAQVFALNASALRHALSFRPALTLSAHAVTSPAASAIRRLCGAPTAQYFHASEILHRPRLSAYAAEHADVAIAVSAYTASLIRASGARTARIAIIPPGSDLPSHVGPPPCAKSTVLTIAQLKNDYKGHDVLIEALAGVRHRVPDLRWVVIGDGPLRTELERLAQARGLNGSARFLGWVSDAERDDWLRRADVFAMPSRLPGEGFGIVYLEAGVYGVPVVAGNVGGPLDAVEHGVSGLLVDPTDPAAVGEAVASLLLDRELAARLGRQGAERVRERFAWPLIARRVEATLLESLRSH